MAKRRDRPPFAGLCLAPGLCLALVHAEDKIDGRGTNTRRAQGLTRGGEEKLVDNDYFKYKLRAKLDLAAFMLRMKVSDFEPSPRAVWTAVQYLGDVVQDSYAAWACHIVNTSGLAASTIVLGDEISMLRCCADRCGAPRRQAA